MPALPKEDEQPAMDLDQSNAMADAVSADDGGASASSDIGMNDAPLLTKSCGHSSSMVQGEC